MTKKNIVHKIVYNEQNYISSNTKTQQFIIPLLDDTSNKNNKNVTNNHKEKLNPLSFLKKQMCLSTNPCLFTNPKMVFIMKHFLVDKNFMYHLSLWPLGATKYIIGLKSEKLEVQFLTSPKKIIIKKFTH
jgi:hypothetical protein